MIHGSDEFFHVEFNGRVNFNLSRKGALTFERKAARASVGSEGGGGKAEKSNALAQLAVERGCPLLLRAARVLRLLPVVNASI